MSSPDDDDDDRYRLAASDGRASGGGGEYKAQKNRGLDWCAFAVAFITKSLQAANLSVI